jgi:hypothetical protein
MLTPQDLNSILQLLSSDRLTVRGNEVLAIASLQQRLVGAIQAATQQAKDDADSAGPTQ